MSIVVLAPGMLSTVQDGGRIGHAALGIGRAGAMDDAALRLANILVGNVDNAAALEITLRGPQLRFDADVLIAVTGAAIDVRCNGAPVPAWRPVAVRAGCQVAFGAMQHGTRSYIAIGGGIDAPAQLGSRSCDINSGIGGRALSAGDVLLTGRAENPVCRTLWRDHDKQGFVAANWSLDPQPWFDADASTPIRAVAAAHFRTPGRRLAARCCSLPVFASATNPIASAIAWKAQH